LQGGLLLGDPVFYTLAGALLEGYTEGAVAAVTAAVTAMPLGSSKNVFLFAAP